jgi:undecaprenyl-diphosphatase
MRPRLHHITGWLRNLDLFVLLAGLALVVGILAFVLIADAVRGGGTQSMDEAIIRSLRRPDDPATPIGPTWMLEVGRDLTALGGVTVLGLATVAVVCFLASLRAYHAMWLVLAATIGGLVLSTLLKHLFDRPRPNLVPHLSQVYTSSFPSGHSMLSATVYLTLGALLARLVRPVWVKLYLVAVALLVTFLVGCSRVYMGVHFPTDVLAGWCAGLSWALLCWLAARFLQGQGVVESAAVELGPSGHNGEQEDMDSSTEVGP